MKSIKIELPATFTYMCTPLGLYPENIFNFHMNMKSVFLSINVSTSSFDIPSREAYHGIHILRTLVIQIISVENNCLPLIILPNKKTSKQLLSKLPNSMWTQGVIQFCWVALYQSWLSFPNNAEDRPNSTITSKHSNHTADPMQQPHPNKNLPEILNTLWETIYIIRINLYSRPEKKQLSPSY